MLSFLAPREGCWFLVNPLHAATAIDRTAKGVSCSLHNGNGTRKQKDDDAGAATPSLRSQDVDHRRASRHPAQPHHRSDPGRVGSRSAKWAVSAWTEPTLSDRELVLMRQQKSYRKPRADGCVSRQSAPALHCRAARLPSRRSPDPARQVQSSAPAQPMNRGGLWRGS